MKYCTLGEIMLRLSTPGAERFVQARNFEVNYGGGEANVAVSLANYGCEVSFISKVPDNAIGDSAVNALREFGVDVSKIARGGERLGIYFLESGVAMRPSKVIYDRSGSAVAEATVNDFDFTHLLADCGWLHVSGITPAISKAAAEVTLEALKTARKLGITTSFDLNYRAKLWTKEQARACLIPMMKYVDYVIGNEEDAQSCLGFVMSGDASSGTLDFAGYEKMLQELCAEFSFKGAATSLRESHSASDNGWSCACWINGKFFHSNHYEIRIIDRVGAGDSFAGGLIYGLTHYQDTQSAIEFAAAASALKHTIPGDFNHVGVKEVEALMGGDASGRVQR
jgi:2-dehydro-3-deoxygluconokinase